MAQHTLCAMLFSSRPLELNPSLMAALGESKEQQTVPTSAGHLAGNCAEGTIISRLIFKALGEHLHHDLAARVAAAEKRARLGQPPIPLRPGAAPRYCGLGFGRPTPETLRCAGAQVGILGNLGGPAACPFTHIALGVHLELPGNASEQELLAGGSTLFPNHLSVPDLQRRYC